MFHPITEALAQSAELKSGHRVLDIAAGIGEPSLSLAQQWVTAGGVCCTDVVAQMLSVAQTEARRRSLGNVCFARCSADELPFPDATFDAAVCRLGIMFVPNPLAGIQEALRAIKPGARLTYAVWHRSDANPFFNIVTRALERHVHLPAFDPEAPTAFRFAEPQRLRGLIEQAGAIRVQEIASRFRILIPFNIEQFWTFRADMSETLRTQRAQLPAEKLLEVASDFKSMARPFFSSGQLVLPAEVLIVSGMKPS